MTLHDPELEVTCDKCDCSEYLRLTATARGYDERDVPGQLKRLGWMVDGDKHYCQDCILEGAER